MKRATRRANGPRASKAYNPAQKAPIQGAFLCSPVPRWQFAIIFNKRATTVSACPSNTLDDDSLHEKTPGTDCSTGAGRLHHHVRHLAEKWRARLDYRLFRRGQFMGQLLREGRCLLRGHWLPHRRHQWHASPQGKRQDPGPGCGQLQRPQRSGGVQVSRGATGGLRRT